MDWGLILENALRAGVGSEAVFYSLAAIGLNIQFGYTGLVNFGQVAFVAAGAYGLAMAVNTYGWSMWTGLFVGIVAAIVLAAALGAPALRLRLDYLAIVTIAASETVRLILRSVTFDPWTGGSNGLQAFADDFYDLSPLSDGEYGFWVFRFSERATWLLLVGWTLVILAVTLNHLLVRSPWGRVIKAIREDEDAVRSLGKNVNSYKLQALVLGGVIAAFGGFVFALSRASVQPDNYSTAFTFFAYTVLILGGTARVLGPVIGAMVFWSLLQFTDVALRQGIDAGHITFLSGNEVGIVRQMLVGAGLMALVVFRPQGILGDKREVAVSVRR